ncbi:putative bifunctional diguanylate cyclase/phosphodiesterase [Desulfolutivibrio sulfoxidireducens]|nr:EAL domain-containing protein [Desulfolutivibrio sulfoxidireducens]QLA16646.1 EAL domain-containing protein [Desulfolutivibrio sulfoxidireducens]QLA21596.1 EAL domain-containing protein [Desulfolutivibrio sulfoxidireducens]
MPPDLFQDILDSLPGHVAALDQEGLVATVNASLAAFAADHSAPVSAMFRPGADFFAACAEVFPDRQAAAVCQGAREVLGGQRPRFMAEVSFPRQDHEFWFSLVVTSRLGPQAGAILTFMDITRQKQLEEHILHDAFHDTLTGLFNRALFINRLERAINRIRRAPNQNFAVIYLDIDRFKLVNKTFGHVTGDRLLMVVANRLQKATRASDTLARFGGDEFAVLVEDVDGPDGAIAAAERILCRMASPFTLRKQNISITVSIGVVLGTTAYEHPDHILRDADNAMYSSKEHGGNHSTLFDAGMRVISSRRMEIELDLGKALAANEIMVYYQPIVSLRSGRITGLEALARWRHPRLGMIPPMEFIPVAEESNLINVLGDMVFRKACERLTELSRKFPATALMTMSVNISARQFRRPDFVSGLRDILERTGAPPERMCLEVTESMLMEDAESAARTIRELKDLGLRVVIDDFGTGYSSLSYLQRFPFDSLKVDRSFVGTMNETRQNREIIRTIIAMARHLGLEVVAEGVEICEHRDMLTALDCEFAQGFLFSEPLESEALDALLERHDGDCPSS